MQMHASALTWRDLLQLESVAVAQVHEWPRENEWDHIENAVRRLRDLHDDWDGMGAKAPSRALLDNSIDFLRYMNKDGNSAPVAVSATPLGYVMFEWHEPDYLEVVLPRPYYAEWF